MAITVDTNFPSGNGLIERIEDGHIYLRPDLRDTEGPWFWWHIRVTGCADRVITVHLLEEHCLTARGACWSPNGLDDWQWVSDFDLDAQTVQVPATPYDVLHVALAMPYHQHHLQHWLQHHPNITVSELCRSAKQQQPVPLLETGPRDGSERYQVLDLSPSLLRIYRELGAEGFVEGLMKHPQVKVIAVPIVDVDGVEAGDQGKNRPP